MAGSQTYTKSQVITDIKAVVVAMGNDLMEVVNKYKLLNLKEANFLLKDIRTLMFQMQVADQITIHFVDENKMSRFFIEYTKLVDTNGLENLKTTVGGNLPDLVIPHHYQLLVTMHLTATPQEVQNHEDFETLHSKHWQFGGEPQTVSGDVRASERERIDTSTFGATRRMGFDPALLGGTTPNQTRTQGEDYMVNTPDEEGGN